MIKPRTLFCLSLAMLVLAGFSLQSAEFSANDFGAKPDESTINTAAIQKAIDAAAEAGGGTVVLQPGSYSCGAIFLKSNVELQLDEGVVIKAIQDDTLYPERPTRVAGIEMVWPSALVNVYQQTNVVINGKGIIDGNGEYWWHKFWGLDGKSGMLGDYRDRGLRWAVDYDCKRVRALAVYDSKDVEIHDVTIKRSGFWSLTLTYSEDVTVDGVNIRANIGGYGPSSDGVDIDSSRNILVQNCDIDCNDDNICLKAGRDADGLRVNRVCENITIRNCVTRSGHGMLTLGSETSGGIRNVFVDNLKAYGTSNGIRIKSARIRGGVLQNIRIQNLEMVGVDNPLQFELNWYPSYSYPTIPEGVNTNSMPVHWSVLTQHVEPPERGIPEVRDLYISNVNATGAATAIYANAYPEKPIRDVHLENVTIEAKETGSLKNAADWTMKNVQLRIVDGGGLTLDHCDAVEMPRIVAITEGEYSQSARSESSDPNGPVRLGIGSGEQDN